MRWQAALVGVVLLMLGAGCRTSPSAKTGTSKLQVVAAENVWGSLAGQLGGDRVEVTSIIDNPSTDPHDYEPTAQDARAIASAGYVVFNGLGYDSWAGRAVDANPSDGRKVLDVGRLLGRTVGDNPHRWYFPDDVEAVLVQITADYKALDPSNAAYYDQRHQDLEAYGLRAYKDLLAQIERKHAQTPVAATESIFVGIAEKTGLDLQTPAGYMTAISEGVDPTARDKSTTDAQVSGRQVAVLVFNDQNATPDVQALVEAARAAGVPVVAITETLSPPEATFQDWQSAQLQRLADALAKASGS